MTRWSWLKWAWICHNENIWLPLIFNLEWIHPRQPVDMQTVYLRVNFVECSMLGNVKLAQKQIQIIITRLKPWQTHLINRLIGNRNHGLCINQNRIGLTTQYPWTMVYFITDPVLVDSAGINREGLLMINSLYMFKRALFISYSTIILKVNKPFW